MGVSSQSWAGQSKGMDPFTDGLVPGSKVEGHVVQVKVVGGTEEQSVLLEG